MKVEFLVNTEINDGRQLFISATEFLKRKTTKKSSIVLLLPLMLYFHSMVWMISSNEMSMKKF